VLAVVVRIWRTVLEALPGIIALAIGTVRDRDQPADQPS
jgi:hypothetical protein